MAEYLTYVKPGLLGKFVETCADEGMCSRDRAHMSVVREILSELVSEPEKLPQNSSRTFRRILNIAMTRHGFLELISLADEMYIVMLVSKFAIRHGDEFHAWWTERNRGRLLKKNSQSAASSTTS